MLKRIFSYFLVLCLGLALAMFFVFDRVMIPSYRASLQDEVQSVADMQCEALESGVLFPINQLTTQLISSAGELSALAARASFTMSEALPSLRLLENQAVLSDSFLDGTDLYLLRSDTFLSSRYGIIDASDPRSLSLFPWFEQYGADMDNGIHVSCYSVTLAGHTNHFYAFSRALFLPLGDDYPPCIISYVLSASTLRNLLSVTDDPLFAEDKTGHVVALTAGTDVSLLETYSGDLCISARSANGMRILRPLPTVRIDAQLSALRRGYLLGLAVICLFSCVCGYYASWRLSAPIRGLVQQMRKQYAGANGSERTGEMALIAHVVSGLTDRAGRLESELNRSQLIAGQNLLSALLHGRGVNKMDLHHHMEICALTFPDPLFTVMVVQLSAPFLRETDSQSLQLFRVSMMSRIGEIAHEPNSLKLVEEDETSFSVLINHRTTDISIALDTISHALTGEDPELCRVISAGVSSPVYSIQGLGRAWEQARDALSQKFTRPHQTILFYIPESAEPLPFAPAEALRTLNKLLEAGNVTGALTYLTQTLAQMKHANVHQRAKKTLRPFLTSFARHGLLTDALPLVDLTKLESCVATALEDFNTASDPSPGTRKHQVVRDVISFIDTHLDEMISLSDAAEAVDLSAPYLSRLFKEVVGENFNEYVNTRRMLSAQRQLLTTGATVDQIARNVGFTTSNYFIKRFKQYFGATPAAYRSKNADQTPPQEGQTPAKQK